MKWTDAITLRVSSAFWVRVPSGLYSVSSFSVWLLPDLGIFLILADSLTDSVSLQNVRHASRCAFRIVWLYIFSVSLKACLCVWDLLFWARFSLCRISLCAKCFLDLRGEPGGFTNGACYVGYRTSLFKCLLKSGVTLWSISSVLVKSVF